MRIVVASDSEASAQELKQSLLHNKLCTDVYILPLNSVADRGAQYRPRCVILDLPDNPERAVPLVRDIQEALHTRILVVGPAASAKLILHILQEGAFQYIDYDDRDSQLTSAFAKLSEAFLSERQMGRLITVVGAGGGNGSSTLAANLAAGLAQRHEKSALIDLRTSSGDLAALLDVANPAHTLADFCRHVDRMDAHMFSQCLTVHSSGIHLLAAPKSFRESSAVTPRGVRKALGMARSLFDYVLVDLDTPSQIEQTQVLFRADTVLVVMRLDFSSVRHAQDLLAYFDDLQVESRRVHVVAGRYGRPKELKASEVEQSLGRKIEYFIPDDGRRVNSTNNQPVLISVPDCSRRSCSLSNKVLQSCVSRRASSANSSRSRPASASLTRSR
jgi:pilus assembly protein CpaE